MEGGPSIPEAAGEQGKDPGNVARGLKASDESLASKSAEITIEFNRTCYLNMSGEEVGAQRFCCAL